MKTEQQTNRDDLIWKMVNTKGDKIYDFKRSERHDLLEEITRMTLFH